MVSEKEAPESLSTDDRHRRLAQLTAKYLQKLPQQLADIKAALEDQNYALVKIQVHNIKGTSGTYRLNSIFESAARLEYLADEQNKEESLNTVNEMMRLIKEQIRKLELEII